MRPSGRLPWKKKPRRKASRVRETYEQAMERRETEQQEIRRTFRLTP